jgi:tetratricopeptide (TPR) repeat protein
MRSIRHRLVSAVSVVTIVAVPVLALSSSATTYPPPCDASKVSKSDSDRAHTVFLSGRQYLDESNYDKAISYFNDAYSIDCSVHGILPIIATAFERQGNRAEAVRALEEYQRRAPNAGDHEVIERRIRNLKDQIARETPPPPPPSASAPPPPPPPPPSASAAPEPPAPPPPPPPAADHAGNGPGVAPWVLVGVGGAALVTGVIVYAVGASAISSAQNECPSRMGCPSDVASKGNGGRSTEVAGAVVGGIGVAAAAAGVVWKIVGSSGSGSSPAAGSASTAPPAARVSLAPAFAPGYVGLNLGGAL